MRERLLGALVGRWDHRVTTVVGGPGLGKTTLLAQALAENRMAPRGEDVWIGMESQDTEVDRLASVVAEAVAGDIVGSTAPSLDPGFVADAVWRRAPTEACIVLDDVHLVTPGSPGAVWLNDLVGKLPSNGHMVVASRSEPPLPLARLDSQGAVLRLGEADLLFSDDELSGFADRRGVDPARFERMGGWPAMVALAASVQQEITGDYLWEEVIEPLGTVGRHVLAVLCDLGGADDDLMSAAVGSRVALAEALARVPLVDRVGEGWYVPHKLWRSAPGLALTSTERTDIRRRAAGHLCGRGRFDDAFVLVQEVELWDVAPSILRAACLTRDRVVMDDLGRWLASSPDVVRSSTAGSLARAVHIAFTSPSDAVEPLQTARSRCQSDGDVAAELTAIAQLVRLAWWNHELADLEKLAASIAAHADHVEVRSLVALGRVLAADLRGDDEAVLAELASIEQVALDPVWDIIAVFLNGLVHVEIGQYQATLDIVDRLAAKVDPAMRYVLDTLAAWATWNQGRLDDSLRLSSRAIGESLRTGVVPNLYIGLTMAAIGAAQLGNVNSARWLLQASNAATPPSPSGTLPVPTAVATASVQLAEGDEPAATATLRQASQVHGLDRGPDRRAWRQAFALSYVLLPETRSHWDTVAAQNRRLAPIRELASIVVAIREGRGDGVMPTFELPEINVVRTSLHYRFAAELAVSLGAAGRSEGLRLLEGLGKPGRIAARSLADSHPQLRRQARSLLTAAPPLPPESTYVAVLGPLVLSRGGREDSEVVVDPRQRRRRVHALLAYLVGHRSTSRSAIIGALWPDLDDHSAANNLSVTLSHLLRLLEPWRASADPPYLLRLEGQAVRLVTDEHLRIDVDDFDRHVAAANQAEADGLPSIALEHHMKAVQLYRGDLHLDAPDADDWYVIDREHYRAQFVRSATRAGQLLVTRGNGQQAEQVARRALDVDPWAEGAYAVLVSSALASGDRSGARRILERCHAALAELGAEPSDTTRQLQRRVQLIDAAGGTARRSADPRR